MGQPILTDANGKPFRSPERAEFETDVAYIRAFYAYKDAIARCANGSFDETLNKAARRPSKLQRP